MIKSSTITNSMVNGSSGGGGGSQPVRSSTSGQVYSSGTITKSRATTPSINNSKQLNSINSNSQTSLNSIGSRPERTTTRLLPTSTSGSRSVVDPSSGKLNLTQTFNSNSHSLKSSKSPVVIARNPYGSISNINKPPPAPSPQMPPPAQAASSASKRRVPLAYGSNRSATTSVVPSSTVNKKQLSSQQQPQQTSTPSTRQAQHQTQRILSSTPSETAAAMARTNTNHSIASSNSSTTSAYASATSPSSMSSMSASSSIQQIAPLQASSPRSGRNMSPPLNMPPPSSNRHKVSQRSGVVSQHGSATVGSRERSISPGNSAYNAGGGYGESNSNLNMILESRIPQSPSLSKKQPPRRSFLPQPVSYQQTSITQRKASISPIRYLI